MLKKYSASFALSMLAVLLFSSCSQKIVGTWSVQKYETKESNNQTVSFTNIGTMTFYKQGSGQKNINYTLLGYNKSDVNPFTWTSDNGVVTITSYGSDFAKTWIVTEDKKKTQKWKSTDGGTGVQSLELLKNKE